MQELVGRLFDTLPSVVTAAAGASPLVSELGLCLLAAGFLSAVFERLRIPTIAALLGAGVLVGPVGLGLVTQAADIETIASLGLTLLLFVIGLEVNPRSLLTSGRTLLVTGAVQVPLTVLLAATAFFGLSSLLPQQLADKYTILYLALACAFSSTLLVVRFLQQHRWLDTVAGRLSVGLLIFQDIWAIVVLALQPSFEAPEWTPIALTFGGIFLLVGLAAVTARYLLSSLFNAVAKHPDLMVSVALAWCFFVGLAGANLGRLLALFGISIDISVSLEMGALIAGMMLASSPYHHDVAAKISNLRDFFVTLFFVALGMSIPVPRGSEVLLIAALLVILTLLSRLLVFFPLLCATGLDRTNALSASIKLSQISEFCLVIVYLGVKAGHIEAELASSVIFAFVATALLTPSLFRSSRTLPQTLAPLLDWLGFKSPAEHVSNTAQHGPPRIVILGFHRVAFALLQDLGRQHPDWLSDVLVVDTNVNAHAAIRELGARVSYGDAGNAESLRHAQVGAAQVVISTVPDELLSGTSNEAIIKAVRSISRDVPVFASASHGQQAQVLYAAGATYVYSPSVETANGVLGALVASLEGKLDDFQVTRLAACGPLLDRGEILR